jgi:filamentous hemagglutinin family protein
MPPTLGKYLSKLSLGLGFSLSLIYPATGQITPNGAGTVANPQGNQINITGGTQAGANLFHSFQDFNVNSSQVANFLSNPQTQNILGRINGGNPSVINGLLQVTGGSSNLFLMNPAGIIFGQGASLNVPASFTATTANGIGFGNSIFNAFGDNNFSALTGNPDSFLFTTNQAGSIVNAGNLAVGTGQNISLIAGNSLNTGNLTAPGGEIQLLAVPGTNRVRLSQPGQVLSLEFVPPVSHEFRAVDLPALLTGSDLPGIVVNPSGQVQVAGTSLPNQQGLAVASGRIDVSSVTGMGGTVQVMGDRVAALNSRINANGATGGGTVRLGGEYLGGINTGIAPALRFNAQRTLVDRNSLIRVNATNTGAGGRAIVWADDTTGFYGRITGRGATERGGFVEVSGKVNLDFDGRVELPGANGLFGTLLLDPTDITIQAGAGNGDALLPNVLVGDLPANMTIDAAALAAILASTNISLAASNSITFTTPVTFAACTVGACGAISFTAGGAFNSGGNNIRADGRDLSITAANITTGDLRTSILTPLRNGGNITLNATSGNVLTGSLDSGSFSGNGGGVNLTSTGGNITTGALASSSNNGNGGLVNLNAPSGNVVIANSTSGSLSAISGAVSINAGGDITARANTSTASGTGGGITLTAGGNINVNALLFSGAGTGTAGAINLTAGGNIIAAGAGISSNTTGGSNAGGVINLTAGGNINAGNLFSDSNSGNAGAIGLTALNGNISVDIISAQSLTGGAGIGGNVNVNAGNLFFATGDFAARDATQASITTQGGAGGGAITITHGGGVITPFLVTNATNNGTFRAITSGAGANTVSNTSVPLVAINNYGTNISIRTTLPVATPTIDLALLQLLTNPAAPATPTPVVVGTPPAPEILPMVELPNPLPSLPLVPPAVTPVAILPTPAPVVPVPSPQPNPQPSPDNQARLQLPAPPVERSIEENSSLSRESLADTLALVTELDSVDLEARLSRLEGTFQGDIQQYLGITPPSTSNGDRQGSSPSGDNPSVVTPNGQSTTNLGNGNPAQITANNQQNSNFSRQQVDSEYSLQETQSKLKRITELTGVTPALVYVFFAPQNGTNNFNSAFLAGQANRQAADSDFLEVIVITGEGKPIQVQFPGLSRRQVLLVANEFRSEVTNVRSSRGFLRPSRQIYQWLMASLEDELQARGVNNLVFLMDTGLRSIPLAAMHDGNGFIVERYSVGLMPSLNLTPPTYNPLDGSQVLAMGATTFTSSGLNPLPAVSLELNTVSQLWQGSEFLNDRFTFDNLLQQRQITPFRMIHLATHASFAPGDRSNSYIQLWDQRLTLDQLSQLNWGNPPVDLLVLSACQTALGDRDAELGFASLAINAGVRSALASLWEVDDAATLGLMTKFYQQLQVTTTKAEALRQAQLAMIRGEVRLENGNLVTANGQIPLTEELKELGDLRVNHPYYWSAFTMVGNPW